MATPRKKPAAKPAAKPATETAPAPAPGVSAEDVGRIVADALAKQRADMKKELKAEIESEMKEAREADLEAMRLEAGWRAGDNPEEFRPKAKRELKDPIKLKLAQDYWPDFENGETFELAEGRKEHMDPSRVMAGNYVTVSKVKAKELINNGVAVLESFLD